MPLGCIPDRRQPYADAEKRPGRLDGGDYYQKAPRGVSVRQDRAGSGAVSVRKGWPERMNDTKTTREWLCLPQLPWDNGGLRPELAGLVAHYQKGAAQAAPMGRLGGDKGRST